MFFTKPYFFLLFLPVLTSVYWLVMQRKQEYGVWLLLTVSLLLYLYSSPRYFPLMVFLIGSNFALAVAMGRAEKILSKRMLLGLAIALDLVVLGYYKYRGATFGGVPTSGMIFPLGISFFTITLIVYVHQSYQNGKTGTLRNLGLVVSYFPHLAAGPILNYGEVDKQLSTRDSLEIRTNIARGILMFAIGLAKKLFLADSISPYSDFVFNYASGGGISFVYAWLGAWAFLLELYFDFSGYTDMACGISLLFGIQLPLNFNSPLKATSYIEVWNRWHMSLTRVLRELVFKPLGGMRRSATRRNAALVVTMVIGGLWHGATFNFFLFGLFSGIALVINHRFRQRFRWNRQSTWIRVAASRIVTLTTITTTCVLFRAPDWKTILSMFSGMIGRTGFLASSIVDDSAHYIPETVLLRAMGLSLPMFLMLSGALTAVALIARNSNEIVEFRTNNAMGWRPSLKWGAYTGLLLALGLASITHTQKFLYVNF